MPDECVCVRAAAAAAACSVHIIHYDRRSDDFVQHSAHNDYVLLCENEWKKIPKKGAFFFVVFTMNKIKFTWWNLREYGSPLQVAAELEEDAKRHWEFISPLIGTRTSRKPLLFSCLFISTSTCHNCAVFRFIIFFIDFLPPVRNIALKPHNESFETHYILVVRV